MLNIREVNSLQNFGTSNTRLHEEQARRLRIVDGMRIEKPFCKRRILMHNQTIELV